jgi:hypothetical protein
LDNEGAWRQQEGEFEVLEGRGRQGVVPVYDTGEATAGGFWGEVWVLIGFLYFILLPVPGKSY